MLFTPRPKSLSSDDYTSQLVDKMIDLWEGRLGISDVSYMPSLDLTSYFLSALPSWRSAELRAQPSANRAILEQALQFLLSADSMAHDLARRVPLSTGSGHQASRSMSPENTHHLSPGGSPDLPPAGSRYARSSIENSCLELPPIQILFLAANPDDQRPLHTDREVRGIESVLRQAEDRERFSFLQEHAVQAADLEACLLRHKPHIVHFSGHGSPEGLLYFEGPRGHGRGIEAPVLGRLFSLFAGSIRCVVLNACHSQAQAQAIAEYIDFVIGMSRSIGDLAAIAFSSAFYQALAHGRSVQSAFDLACLQITLVGPSSENVPRLYSPRQSPDDAFFYPPA